MSLDYNLIIWCLIIGYILWLFSALFFNKKNYETQKQISLLLSMIWIISVVSKIAFHTEIPTLFDIVWAGALGINAGVDVIKYLPFVNKWNQQ